MGELSRFLRDLRLFVLIFVLAGGQSFHLFEHPVEGGFGVEAGSQRNVEHRLVFFPEQLFGVLDPTAVDVLIEAHAQAGVDGSGHITLIAVQQTGQIP